MPIVRYLRADQFGSHIGKYSERLKLTQGGQTLAQAPLLHLQGVTIANMGVSISADAIAACCERGIPIVFMDAHGEVYASLYAAGLVGTVLTRRAQLLAYTDTRGFALATAIGAAKVNNQAATLRYWARLRRENAPEQATALLEGADQAAAFADRIAALSPAPLEEARDIIMGLEGNAARLYWAGAALMIPESYGWPGRVGRGAVDPINSLLNYGYGILYAEVERAIILAGLDPYAGFIHADRPGKPSLVLDLIEEFRQIAVDRPVIGLAARRYAVPMDDRGRLTDEVRRDFADKIVAHLDTPVRDSAQTGDRLPIRYLIQNQARQLATFLRGERDAYRPFVAES
ncbi:MAG: CRISPR-associated endonuclease Cas1 [Anaerolineae bacterium]|nr:CRISPR-associated endonuclease Cas1 [Anaerolineae bacterium]